jgi:hypothetical protein
MNGLGRLRIMFLQIATAESSHNNSPIKFKKKRFPDRDQHRLAHYDVRFIYFTDIMSEYIYNRVLW